MPLPFIIGGAILAAGAKVASDMSDVKKYMRWAEEDKEEGEEYLDDAKSAKNSAEYYIEKAQETIKIAKEDGLKCLTKNYIPFQHINLEDPKYTHYKREIVKTINKYHLDISLQDVIEMKKSTDDLIKKLGINVNTHTVNQNANIDSIAEETIANMITHGVVSAGIGGAAVLLGAEFLMATGVGAILVAPIALAVSSDKVKEAKAQWYKASEFRDKAKLEYEKWKGFKESIYKFYDLAIFYEDTMNKFIDLSNSFVKQYKYNNHTYLVAKNLITLAMLNSFIKKEFGKNNIGGFNALFQSIKEHILEEQREFAKIEQEIERIENHFGKLEQNMNKLS